MNKVTLVSGLFVASFGVAFGQTYSFTVLAGMPSEGHADGPGEVAQFAYPRDVALDGEGNIYAADTGNATIRKITTSGIVTTIAGAAGDRGSADGVGILARFSYPVSVAIDRAGNLFVADEINTLRKISPAGVVTTLAGVAK